MALFLAEGDMDIELKGRRHGGKIGIAKAKGSVAEAREPRFFQ
jgi:hypothetical protein